MSISGQLCLYAEHCDDIPRAITQSVKLVDAEYVQEIVWQSRQQESWREAQEWVGDTGDAEWVDDLNDMGASPAGLLDATPWVRRVMARSVHVARLDEFIGKQGLHELFFEPASGIARRMSAVLSVIPEAVRGDFIPCSPVITIGQHDLYEVGSDSATYYGTAALSLALFGYGAPKDWRKYRELVLQVPDVLQLRSQMEQAVGSEVKQCVFWET